MRITLDKSANAVYIYLVSGSSNVEKTYCCDPLEVGGMINLDFDGEGRLIGIEVMGAVTKLPTCVLETAEIIG